MTDLREEPLTPEEAVEKALLYTFQLSGKDYRKMQTAMSEVAFIRALKQDGWTLTRTGHERGPDVEGLAADIHREMNADPLLPDCGGTHMMGYGYCQRIAAIRAALGKAPR